MCLFIRSWHCKDTIVYKLQYTSFSRLIRIAVRLVKRSMRGQIQLKRKGQAEMVHLRPRTCFWECENKNISCFRTNDFQAPDKVKTRHLHVSFNPCHGMCEEVAKGASAGTAISEKKSKMCTFDVGKNGILNLFFVMATQRFFHVHPDFFWEMKHSQFDNCAYFFKRFVFCSTTQLVTRILYPFFPVHLNFLKLPKNCQKGFSEPMGFPGSSVAWQSFPPHVRQRKPPQAAAAPPMWRPAFFDDFFPPRKMVGFPLPIPYHVWYIIYLHEWLIFMVNVGIYTMHGWYGIGISEIQGVYFSGVIIKVSF